MEQKDKKDKNIAAVYRVAMSQLLDSDSKAYAGKPFVGSYEIRVALSDALSTVVNDNMNNNGAAVDSDKAFEEWIDNVKITLDRKNIKYEEK